MRVISGEYRGRRLESLEGRDIRPTTDRVKESLFNILGERLIECSFLDLFGGSGAIGIEALSRGARLSVFIDSSIKSIKVLRGNLESLKIKENAEVYNTDYTTAIDKLWRDNRLFDIIFIDPPYSTGIAQNALGEIARKNILQQGGIIVIEHDHKDAMPEKEGKLIRYRVKQYGNTVLSFYCTEDEASTEETE